ncbi:MAG: sulfur carrier protein ThiS, partial [Tepidisphaeraceae bacterium]|jgi:thiamine biosynthesis protein ThiS
MRIKVNGQDYELAEGSDIHGLLAAHRLTPDKVAVELNRRLVRGEKYDTLLKEGDEVEIVTFVGGG